MSAPSSRYSPEDRLDSWKEIAAYLGREVRTVQGWEKTEGLPIHRHQHARQGSVFAFRPELDAWREARKAVNEPATLPGKGRKKYLAIAAAVLALAEGGVLLWKVVRPKPVDAAVSSIAVLPFLDFSPAKDQEYFSDGLTEEIIDAVSRVPNLRVVARTSAFAFKGRAVDIRQIGSQLGVQAVLEGSVRKSGDELRITAQLNRVSDGSHLWSRTYQRHLRDVFSVQREISEAIAAELRAGQVPAGEPPRNLADAEAYRLLQEGRYFFNQFQPPESNRKAIQRYQQAIDRDPKFAPAYAGLADAYAYLAENFVEAPNEVMPKARVAAQKAVALDEDSAAAHTSLGLVLLDYDRNIEAGQHEFQRAMQLNPGSGYSHHWYAHSLEAQGRLPEAMKEMRAALELDPFSIPINWDIGSELIAAHRYDEAVRHLAKAHELFPNNPIIDYMRVEAYYRVGDRAGERRVMESLRASGPELLQDPLFAALFGVEALREGRRQEAVATLDRMDRLSRTKYVEPFLAIELCSELGEKEKLLDWLRRVDRERSSMFVYLGLFKDFFGLDPAVVAALKNSKRTD